MSDKGTTATGFENPNQQVNIGPLGIPGTDHGHQLYRLVCRPCGPRSLTVAFRRTATRNRTT